MSTRKMTDSLRLSHWSQILRDRANSGLSVRAYCAKESIHENTYFYWQKKLREIVGNQIKSLQTVGIQENLSHQNFVEVKLDEDMHQIKPMASNYQSCEVKIEISGTRVSADSQYPVDKLITLIKGIVRI